jgi:hypothetical protein
MKYFMVNTDTNCQQHKILLAKLTDKKLLAFYRSRRFSIALRASLGLYPEPVEFSPYPHTVFLYDSF